MSLLNGLIKFHLQVIIKIFKKTNIKGWLVIMLMRYMLLKVYTIFEYILMYELYLFHSYF